MCAQPGADGHYEGGLSLVHLLFLCESLWLPLHFWVWVMCGGGANSSCSLAPVKRILCPATGLASLQVVRVVWVRADCAALV
jgi:hypothetical protein